MLCEFFIGLIFHDMYPFTSFPMFSTLRKESVYYSVITGNGEQHSPQLLNLGFYEILNDQARISGNLTNGLTIGNHRFSHSEIKTRVRENWHKVSHAKPYQIIIEEVVVGPLTTTGAVGITSQKQFIFDTPHDEKDF